MDIQQVVKQSRPASMTTLDKLGPSLTGRIRIRTVICYASICACIVGCAMSCPSMSKDTRVQTPVPLRRRLRLQAALHRCTSIRTDALDLRLQAVHRVPGGDV